MSENNKKIPLGHKDSVLGAIPQEWKIKRFGEISSQISTFSFSRDQMTTEDQKLRYIHYGDIHKNPEKDAINLKTDNLPYLYDNLISDEKRCKSDFPYLQNGDILLADASEDYDGIGKSWEIIDTNNNYIIGGLHTIAARCNINDITVGYGKHLFRHNEVSKSLKRIAQGTKVYSISYKNLSTLNIILPTLAEQEKIAKILSLWDDAIEKQKKLVKQLELRKRGLMQQLLTGKIRVGGFVEEWKELKLGYLFSERIETNENELPLISITADKGAIYQTDSDKKDNSNDDKSKYKKICVGDIGYNTMRLWQGRCALSNIEGIVSPAYTVVIPNKNALNTFFEYLFKMPHTIYQFWTHSQGLVSDTLNCKYKDFKIVQVLTPSFPEQTAIANILTTADQEIDLAKKKLELFRTQKRALMQQLLTGKTRVKT